VVYNRAYALTEEISPARARHEAALQGALYREAIEDAADRSVDGDSFRSYEVTSHEGARHMLSWRRHLPLRLVPIAQGTRALEIGAGCGAITRYLGEHSESVLAIEPVTSLATAARLRCSDLDHVTISTTRPEVAPQSDLVVALIGDDERDSPLLDDATLAWLSSGLSESGLMILGVPHSRAVLDLNDPSSDAELDHPDAHDRRLLSERLDAHGLTERLWLTPYPDHLLPSVFLTDEAATRSSRTLGAWAGRERHPRHRATAGGLLRDLEVYGDLGERGLLGDRASALLVIAARTPEALPVLHWQVQAFNGERRRRETQTQSLIRAHSEPLVVEKSGSDHTGSWFSFHPTSEVPFFEGTLLEAALVSAVEAGDRDAFFELTRAHAQSVTARFAEPGASAMPHKSGPGDVHLRGQALDAVYGNFVLTTTGLEVFDLEWSTTPLVPLSFVIFRSLMQLNDVIAPGELATRLDLAGLGPAGTYEEMVLLLLEQISPIRGLQMGHLKLFQDLERAFQRFVQEGDNPDIAPPALLLHQGVVTAQAHRDVAMARQVKAAMARFFSS